MRQLSKVEEKSIGVYQSCAGELDPSSTTIKDSAEKALVQGLSAMQAGPWTCDKPGSGCSCQDSCDGCNSAACECPESDTWEDADDPGKRE